MVSKVFDSTLFDHLDSTWDFKVGPSPSSTWLTFSVDFGFKSPLYRSVAAVFFEEVCFVEMTANVHMRETLMLTLRLQQE